MFHTLGEAKKRVPVAEREPPCRIEGERLVAQRADRLVCASDHERRLLEDVYGADPRRISVVACGVDLGLFKPIDREAARDALRLNGKKMVLFVGRIEPLKGVDILLAAAAQLGGESDFQVFIVGGDGTASAEMRRLQGLASELGVSGRVSFLGPVDHDRLPLFYNAADICVVPSYYESFGLVALEAMACGTPVVASSASSVPEAVGDAGLLVDPLDVDGLAAALETAITDSALRADLRTRGLARAAAFTWQRVARRWLEILATLIDSAG
jgi:D-inositol-3-phosphate glycosyltransferase